LYLKVLIILLFLKIILIMDFDDIFNPQFFLSSFDLPPNSRGTLVEDRRSSRPHAARVPSVDESCLKANMSAPPPKQQYAADRH
jgi:hypothetical protein